MPRYSSPSTFTFRGEAHLSLKFLQENAKGTEKERRGVKVKRSKALLNTDGYGLTRQWLSGALSYGACFNLLTARVFKSTLNTRLSSAMMMSFLSRMLICLM